MVSNAPIAHAHLPEDIRPQYEAFQCRESIAALESLLATGGHNFNVGTGDLNLILGGDVYADMNCIAAKADVGAGQVVAVVNAVRNRILDFALALEKEDPNAGQPASLGGTHIQPERVSNLFQTFVNGGSPIIGGNVSVTVQQGDVASLQSALAAQGIKLEDLEGLTQAVAEDPKPSSTGSLGPKVLAWLGKMAMKVGETAISSGSSVAVKVLTEAISKYYGLH